MKLTGLHFLLTYQCTFECDHCFVWGGPRQGGTMTLPHIRQFLQQAAEAGTIKMVAFEGGEPFLYYATLRDAVELAGQERDDRSGAVGDNGQADEHCAGWARRCGQRHRRVASG